MLEHAAEPAHGIERRREASSVVAARVPAATPPSFHSCHIGL
jgi:hypothetical protein